MRYHFIVDTGPLVALLDKSDTWHQWAVAQWSNAEPPLLTCSAVIAESCHLLQRVHHGKETVLAMISRGVIQVAFDINQESEAVRQLIMKYASVPMSLADSCLVRMTEQHPSYQLLTLDSDFLIYRKHGNQAIPCLRPLG
ncbi:MAG: PIN domain-containing protein [Leptolyngbyaceae bacterium]|nr:PIN domain-containing protein [Leptolyngbyaceae bacterium]